MDFSNSDTVVWNATCTNAVNQTACSASPLNMKTQYSNTSQSRGNFTDQRFTSYTVSGELYFGDICFENRCTTVDLYVGNTIDSDALMFDVDGAYGIIGMGPYSPLWSEFLGPDDTSVNYSVKIGAYVLLEDEPMASSAEITDYYKTVIEFAEPLPDYYDNYEYVWLQADMVD